MSENTTPPSTPPPTPSTPPPPAPPSTFSVELMTTETFNLGEAAVGVADLFEGTNPPVEFLRKRASDMLRANPWLAGRLKTVDGQPHLVWEAEPSAADEAELFSVVDVKDLPGVEDVNGAIDLLNMYVGPETPPLAPPLERLVCKTGELSIDKDVPLVRIRLITDSAGFALILTISHAIGDGATLYQIHKQFSDGAVKMDATRKNKDFFPTIEGHKDCTIPGAGHAAGSVGRQYAGLSDNARKTLERFASAGVMTPPEEVTNAPQMTLTFGYGVYYISSEEIDKRKQAHVAEPDAKFVSTNDIITSWFLDATQVDIGILAFNARKAAGIEGTAGGNYQVVLEVDPPSFSPAGIRKIVNDTAPPPVVPDDAPPPRVGLVTNWTQHHKHIDLPGAACAGWKHVLHRTVQPLAPNCLAHFSITVNSCIVVFSPKPGRIAISGMALEGWNRVMEGDMIDGPVEFFKPPPGPVADFSRTNGDE